MCLKCTSFLSFADTLLRYATNFQKCKVFYQKSTLGFITTQQHLLCFLITIIQERHNTYQTSSKNKQNLSAQVMTEPIIIHELPD